MRCNNTLRLLSFVILALNGCATTKSDLISKANNVLLWEVDESCDKVFKIYKDYSEENLSGGDFLWSGGLRVKGYFYGPNAEISIKMEGNPLARITYLHFELEKKEKKTLVKVWYYNTPWRRNAEKFTELLPTMPLEHL
jgi:hypothetical protein